jgi:hypothetical protein
MLSLGLGVIARRESLAGDGLRRQVEGFPLHKRSVKKHGHASKGYGKIDD